MRSALFWPPALLAGLPLLLAACDAAPGLPASGGAPPVLSDFAFTPERLNVASPGEGADVVEVPLVVEVTARDPEGDVREVRYVVSPPTSGAGPLLEGTLEAAGDEADVYRDSTTLRLPTAEVGVYTIRVFATDAGGQASNQAIGSLRFTASGGAPVIEELIVPERVQRPSEGTRRVAFVAVVSDPDGLANVSAVRFWNVDSPGSKFALFDDGNPGRGRGGGRRPVHPLRLHR